MRIAGESGKPELTKREMRNLFQPTTVFQKFQSSKIFKRGEVKIK